MEAKNRAKGLSSDHGTPRDSSRQSKVLFIDKTSPMIYLEENYFKDS